jgi:hypothetical protein
MSPRATLIAKCYEQANPVSRNAQLSLIEAEKNAKKWMSPVGQMLLEDVHSWYWHSSRCRVFDVLAASVEVRKSGWYRGPDAKSVVMPVDPSQVSNILATCERRELRAAWRSTRIKVNPLRNEGEQSVTITVQERATPFRLGKYHTIRGEKGAYMSQEKFGGENLSFLGRRRVIWGPL